ncbi:MAG: microcompartment protein CcmK/EutM [Planctomycetota bacterium]|jgi:microcompartment protein CcmK/EutM
MILAEVVGTVVTPVQIKAMEGHTLLMVRPVTPTGERVAKTRVAVDRVGAGVGDRVLILDEGNSARQILSDNSAPIKTIVVAFVDYVSAHGATVYNHQDTGTQA